MDIAIIREALTYKPFQPFVLQMNDGRTFAVHHPDWVLLYTGHVTVYEDGGETVIHLEPILIASLELRGSAAEQPDFGQGPTPEGND